MGSFGSLQVGSASKFASSGTPTKGEFDLQVDRAQLESPPPPAQYSGLQQGPDLTWEIEAGTVLPVDGSDSLLRSLSPFMIQVEPPLILAGSEDKRQGKDYAGILDAGHSGAPSAFASARRRIKDMPGGDRLSTGGNVESYVTQGYITKPAGGDQEKTVSINPKNPGPGRIGTPAIADVLTAVDITMQLKALVNTPPLILLINPQSLAMSYTKIQQFSDRTRYGFVFQAWGEEQPKLSISARCGAFISGGRGVQFASRRDSAAWQNFQTAYQFYRHNGYIYDTVGKSNAHHMVGALSIHYDGWVYYGHMESFTYTLEEGNQLGGITFDINFTVNAMVDTSKQSMVILPMQSPIPSPSDPRYAGMSYAQPSAGDISVSLDGDVTRWTQNGPDKGARAGSATPDGQPLPASPATAPVVSPKSRGGFVRVR